MKLGVLERKRQEEERQLAIDSNTQMEHMLLNSLIDKSYNDKLYSIAMEKPELWRLIKRKELDNRIQEETEALEARFACCMFDLFRIRERNELLEKGKKGRDFIDNLVNEGQKKMHNNMVENIGDVFKFIVYE
jgi:hypothetical protein